VSSRKEQKERLRREREAREREAKEAERRRRLIGYGAAGALVVAVVVVVAVLLVGGGGGGDEASADVLPDGGEVPSQQTNDLQQAAKAAGCELKSRRVKRSELNPESGNFHFPDIAKEPSDPFNPPTAGAHYPEPADDGAYGEAPPDSALVHTLEHGRVIIWFKPTLPKDARADLKAFFDEDDYQMAIVPRRNMPYAVAASAWSVDPEPLGTGRLLGCRRYSERLFDALRTFRDEHRGNGPEAVP
jgi:Protein of unknown function (DUF3105)